MPLAVAAKLATSASPEAHHWSTPQAHDAKGSPGAAASPRGGFQRSLPAETAGSPSSTPQSSDFRSRGNADSSFIQQRLEQGKQVMLSMQQTGQGGTLNPAWVEGLMGFPPGWTDLPPAPRTKKARNKKTTVAPASCGPAACSSATTAGPQGEESPSALGSPPASPAPSETAARG
jgi:hypothetical protein